MSSQPPPVPPANQSDKGPGNAEGAQRAIVNATPPVSEKTGQQADTKINATPQQAR